MERRHSEATNLSLFSDSVEVECAVSQGALDPHTPIRFRNPNFGKGTTFGDPGKRIIETTPGQVQFNEIWPNGLGFMNFTVRRKELMNALWHCARRFDNHEMAETLEKLTAFGCREAMRSGVSLGIRDLVVPPEKKALIEEAQHQIAKLNDHYEKGFIFGHERYAKVCDIWWNAADRLQFFVIQGLELGGGEDCVHSLHSMIESGACGSAGNLRQLRGLRARPWGGAKGSGYRAWCFRARHPARRNLPRRTDHRVRPGGLGDKGSTRRLCRGSHLRGRRG